MNHGSNTECHAPIHKNVKEGSGHQNLSCGITAQYDVDPRDDCSELAAEIKGRHLGHFWSDATSLRTQWMQCRWPQEAMVLLSGSRIGSKHTVCRGGNAGVARCLARHVVLQRVLEAELKRVRHRVHVELAEAALLCAQRAYLQAAFNAVPRLGESSRP